MARPQPPELPRLPLSTLGAIAYWAPVTFLPLVILVWIFEGVLAAKYAFLISLFVPFAVGLVRSQKNHTRKTAYARYLHHSEFITNLHARVLNPPYPYPFDPALMSPDAAANLLYLRESFKELSGIGLHDFTSDTFSTWESRYAALLTSIRPDLTPDSPDLSGLPQNLAQAFSEDQKHAIARTHAFNTCTQGLARAAAYFAPVPLSPALRDRITAIQSDLAAIYANVNAARDPAFLATLHHTALFAAVTGDPANASAHLQSFLTALERDVQSHLAATGHFLLGTTANVPQPDINTAPPYAITLTPSERRTHTYVIGRTGSGKTTLLKNLITQDLRNPKQGVIVLSPENGIFEALLDLLPPDRADSLIYFDPTDTRPPVIGFNPFTFEDGDDLNQKAQETYTIFERALGDLGVKMTTMLQNASYALIQRKNSRLLDLDTLLNPSNNTLRYKVAQDPTIDERTRHFWDAYNSSSYYKSAYEPVVNRLDPFFRPPHATILSTNSFSWDDVLNKKPHIIFCNLSRLKGMEAQIMGQLLIAQIQQTIFHRDPKPESSYIPYALYIDEFQTYATTGEQSFIETLNKARKYHFALTLAHQVTSDIPPKLLSSIVGNVGTVIALRTSAEDAPFFTKDLQIKDTDGRARPDLLQNLPLGQAIVRTPRHNIGIVIGVPPAPPPLERDTPAPAIPMIEETYAATLKTLSKRNFGKQPTLVPHQPDSVQQQPIPAAVAPVESNGSLALEPEPEDATTIVIDETQTFLPTATRRRGRPPKADSPAPQPVPRTRRRSTTNGGSAPE